MSNRNLIVLSGEAGAGKDSVADILVSKHGYLKLALGDAMKVFCKDVFGWSDDQLWGASHFRNEPDPRWARPCDGCSGSGTVTVLTCTEGEVETYPCGSCNGEGKINDNSPRRVLQLLGDEWARQMIHPDIWTMSARALLGQLLAAGTKVVINNARFTNDRNNLHEWFDAIRVDVKTSRVRSNNGAWRQHGSETSRPANDEVEYAIQNDESWPFPSLETRVATMLDSLNLTPADA